MKKLAILAAVLMLIPASVMAGMNLLNESSLNDVTGQVGITIDQTLQVNDGFFAWTDSDGWGTTGQAGAQGVLKLDNLTINDGGTGSMDLTGMKIDAGTDTGGTTYLVITQPSMEGQIAIGAIYLGTSIAAATGDNQSLGAITIGDLSVAGSTVKISAH